MSRVLEKAGWKASIDGAPADMGMVPTGRGGPRRSKTCGKAAQHQLMPAAKRFCNYKLPDDAKIVSLNGRAESQHAGGADGVRQAAKVKDLRPNSEKRSLKAGVLASRYLPAGLRGRVTDCVISVTVAWPEHYAHNNGAYLDSVLRHRLSRPKIVAAQQ